MACAVTNPVACITEAATSVANAVGQSVLDSMAAKFNEAAEWALTTMTTSWLNLDSPDIESAASPTRWISDHLNFIVMFTLVLSVLIACGRLIVSQKHDHLVELGKSLLRVTVVSTAGAFILNYGIEMGDLFSAWILDQVDFQANQTLGLMALNQPGLIFILAIIVLLVQIIQLGLMIVRGGMLIFLAGVWPLSAAASNTDTGRQWYLKTTAWLLAFLLYKPVAALIYAASMMSMSATNDITTQIAGIFMMILAVAALPALMRFMVPATAAMSGGNAGAMAGAMVGAAVATGAVIATGGAAAGAGAGAGASGFSGAAAAGPTTAGTATSAVAGPGSAATTPAGAPATGGAPGSPGTATTGTDAPTGGTNSGDAGTSDAASGSSPSPAGQPGGADSRPAAPEPSSGAGQQPAAPPASSPSGSSGNGASFADVLRAASQGSAGAAKGDDTASGMVGTQ